ncbi:M20 family metallo-hydrolase [Leucobacter sp. CSA1]|uniref:M20 family metallo-hydrolase n=1 Tax=Leucobacter chromiisoli TaxID=2796471 RepID=A0A934Q7A8_9MICO|nr:M20 family metallo-hydrolase [Leucobacter chromiisoli]MBK0419610.1 M20 family metallo-hydrolase [Leucobacter chromiisoli]
MPHLTSADRLFLDDFRGLERIGATPAGGVHRLSGTAEDGALREWFRSHAEAQGFDVRVDGIGNMFACRELVPGAPYVLVGSHLDSQPLAGRFDGAYGVLAALYAASRALDRLAADGCAPARNLAVVNWFNEEGARFAPSLMGSSVYAGLYSIEDMLEVRDLDGVSVREALDAIGWRGSDAPPDAACYAEIHIEQGRILEREGLDVGVVEASWYTQKLDITVLGEQSHTGATAMADRRDALVAAAEAVLAVHDVTLDFPEEMLVSSVGQHVVEPNSPIVVPRRVHMIADVRSGDPEIVRAARAALLDQFERIGDRRRVDFIVEDFDVREVCRFPEAGIALAEEAMRAEGLASRRLSTMAGHDAVALNSVVPTVLLFTPSVDGVSHCERELTSDEDMLTGVRALTGVVRALLERTLP